MNLFIRSAGLAAATLLATLPAQAHNAWLLPSSTVLSKADFISVDAATSTNLFLADHNAMSLDNLQITAPDGTSVKAENQAKLKLRSVFDVNLAQAGTYRIAVVNAGMFASYKDSAGQTKRLRGTPETIAKGIPADATDVNVTQMVGRIETFATNGKPSAIKPVGVGLELIGTTALTDLAKGEKANFSLLLDGQPAKDMEVTVTRGASQYRDKLEEIKVKTDAKGQFSVTWPAAGMYWLDVSTRDAKTSLPQAKERRLSYAATLEVMP